MCTDWYRIDCFGSAVQVIFEMAVYATAELCRLVASITCQKYISELVMLFWQALLCVELEEDVKCKVVLHLNTVQAKCEGF